MNKYNFKWILRIENKPQIWNKYRIIFILYLYLYKNIYIYKLYFYQLLPTQGIYMACMRLCRKYHCLLFSNSHSSKPYRVRHIWGVLVSLGLWVAGAEIVSLSQSEALYIFEARCPAPITHLTPKPISYLSS